MRFLVYLIGSWMLISCVSTPTRDRKESIALEEIVYQRTEGLLILDKLLNNPSCEDSRMICEKIQIFYMDSQPQLLSLCANKDLNLSMATYKEINEDVENLIQDSISYQDYMLEKLLVNLHEQKNIYMQILEDEDLTSMHYYAFDSYLQLGCFVDDMKYMLEKTYVAK